MLPDFFDILRLKQSCLNQSTIRIDILSLPVYIRRRFQQLTNTLFTLSNTPSMIYPPEKADDTVFVTTRATTTSSLNPFRDTTASGSTTYSPPPGPPPAYVDREFIQPPNPLLQVPKAGPSNRSPSPSSSGFKLAGTTAVDVLNPPPPCFARPPPYNPLMSATFPPCTLISIDAKLENGFPALAPPSSLQPHPFIVHDVKEEDWVRLLNDIKAVGKLSPMNRIVSNVAPLALGVGFFPGEPLCPITK